MDDGAVVTISMGPGSPSTSTRPWAPPRCTAMPGCSFVAVQIETDNVITAYTLWGQPFGLG